jgi:STAS domain
MGPSQASLELTVVALGIVAIALVAVVVGLSIRFYTENARMHRETTAMHANMGETMEKVLTISQSTNERALALMEKANSSGLLDPNELRKQIREETQVVIVEAVRQICDSVERVLSGLLTGIVGHLTTGHRELRAPNGGGKLIEAPEPPPEALPEASPEPRVEYQYAGGWDVVAWSGSVEPLSHGAVEEVTLDLLRDLWGQGPRQIVIDLSGVERISPSAARAVISVRAEATSGGHRVRIVTGTRERSEQLWDLVNGNGNPEHCALYETQDEALAA